jgi:hypothetical protein
MSGLEVVVRPVVLPNIRPAVPRVLAPPDDPEQGIVTLGGSGGRLIDLPYHFTSSVQRQLPHYEQERTFDVNKIKQKDKDGKINEDNFVSSEMMKKLTVVSPDGTVTQWNFADPPKADNIEITEKDQVRKAET